MINIKIITKFPCSRQNHNINRIQLTDISYINFPLTATFDAADSCLVLIPDHFWSPLLSVGLPIHHGLWHIYGILFCGIDALLVLMERGSALREMTVWFIGDGANLRDVCMFLLFVSAKCSLLLFQIKSVWVTRASCCNPRTLCKCWVISVSLTVNVRRPNRLTLSDCVISCICCTAVPKCSP